MNESSYEYHGYSTRSDQLPTNNHQLISTYTSQYKSHTSNIQHVSESREDNSKLVFHGTAQTQSFDALLKRREKEEVTLLWPQRTHHVHEKKESVMEITYPFGVMSVSIYM